MGGPMGADPKLNFVHPALGVLYRAEDFYQASACANCHESLSGNFPYSNKSNSISKFLLRPSPCNAELRWPNYLQEGIPHIQQQAWWFHKNYLTAKIKKAGNPLNPEKISFGLEVFLRAGQALELGDYRLETQTQSKIFFKPHLAGKAENLSILIEGESLLELQGILVKPNFWYAGLLPDNWLQEVNVKEGQVFLRAAIGALNLFRNINNPSYSDIHLQAFILPALPLAYHGQSGEIFFGKDYEKIRDSVDPSILRIPSTYEIYESASFPTLIKFSEIFQLLETFGRISEIRKNHLAPPENHSSLAEMVSSIRFKLDTIPDEIRYASFYAHFHSEPIHNLSLSVETKGLEEIKSIHAAGLIGLKELFVPGVLHLGESQAQLELNYQSGEAASLHLKNIHATLKPHDYGSNDPRQLGWFQITEGEISEGDAIQWLGFNFLPGIHLHRLSKDLIELQCNLKFNITVQLPFIGKIQIETPLLFQTQIQTELLQLLSSQKSENQKLNFIPQSTLLYMPDMKLTRISENEILHMDFTLSDIPPFMIHTQEEAAPHGFLMSARVARTQNTPLKDGIVEFFLALPPPTSEGYDWNELNNFLSLNAYVNFNLKDDQKISGKLDLDRFVDGNIVETLVNASLDESSPQKPYSHSLIDQFRLRSLEKNELGLREQEISIEGHEFHLGDLHLLTPHLFLKYIERQNEDESKEWFIQAFDISANLGKLSETLRGVLRGPLQIQSKQTLKIHYQPTTHQMTLAPLDLSFDFKRISLAGLRRFTQKAITGIDLDGKIQGQWTFNTETYAGKGRILIRGDKEGDIHLRGPSGKRLEAALKPEDPKRLYETPLLANTRFLIDRIESFDPQKEQVRGHFHLSTYVDWLALKVFGFQWNQHDEFTFDFDHLPYSIEGYHQKIREFFAHIAREKKQERHP